MKMLTMIILAVLTTSAQADAVQRNKVVICDLKAKIFQQLAEDYHEKPVWMGHSPIQTTDLVLTVNEDTGSWTLVEYREAWACVLAVGERSRITKTEKDTAI